MIAKGMFGYIIGRKKRMMYVENDADLLWQILVREIYVLMKHYKTKELLQEAFEKIKTTKSTPKKSDITKYKIFTKTAPLDTNWYNLLYYCQSSYINILESGHIINETEERGLIFMLDFNKATVRYYNKDFNGTIQELTSATIEEIMNFDDMPTRTYPEIVNEMNGQFHIYSTSLTKIEKEIDKISSVINEAKKQCSYNIEEKAKKMLDTVNQQRRKINLERRVFYHRLKALDLIETPQETNETTIAGTGSIGDNGSATSASLYFPNGIINTIAGNYSIN